jgi:DNA-binding LacI/PurR family transcriptional regulator
MTRTTPGRQAKPATILDVAAAAGVSRQTVTRAMNDMPGIRQSTRERVQELARELGYTPSRFAKGLVQGSRTSVGLAIPDLTNPYFPAFASTVVELATQRGWHVVMDDYGHGGRNGRDAVEHLAPQVDAVIGYLGGHELAAQSLLGRRPLVVLDRAAGPAAGGVSFDYRHAAGLAIGHLARTGRRKILYLDAGQRQPLPEAPAAPEPGDGEPTEELDRTAASATSADHGNQLLSERGRAFARALDDAALAWTAVVLDDSPESARRGVTAVLGEQPDIDGIVAFNDVMAAGALKALADAGRAVPADCSVIGMDGIPLGELLTPELTTLSLDLRHVGRLAIELLEGLLSGALEPGSPEASLTVRHQLLIRGSA